MSREWQHPVSLEVAVHRQDEQIDGHAVTEPFAVSFTNDGEHGVVIEGELVELVRLFVNTLGWLLEAGA